jgi:hypothetical protein
LQEAQVEPVQVSVLQGCWDRAGDDLERKPLDQRGLSDTWLADDDRIVLSATAQDVDRLANLSVPPKDRVDLSCACLLREVLAETVERSATPGCSFGTRLRLSDRLGLRGFL